MIFGEENKNKLDKTNKEKSSLLLRLLSINTFYIKHYFYID